MDDTGPPLASRASSGATSDPPTGGRGVPGVTWHFDTSSGLGGYCARLACRRLSARSMIRALANAVSGRRSKWVVIAVWVGLLAAFAPASMTLSEVTTDETATAD